MTIKYNFQTTLSKTQVKSVKSISKIELISELNNLRMNKNRIKNTNFEVNIQNYVNNRLISKNCRIRVKTIRL